MKSFYLNGFYEIILALLEIFFIFLRIFFCKNKTVDISIIKWFKKNNNTEFYVTI